MPALATTAMRAPASACATDSAPAEGLALSALSRGRLVGTVRLWHVSAGGVPALVLGPLAVDPSFRKLGIGKALVQRALAAAKARGHGAVLLLGDASYYTRFGFSALKTGELRLPGPFEPDRLLGLELREGALDGAWGMTCRPGWRRGRKASRGWRQGRRNWRLAPLELKLKTRHCLTLTKVT